MTARLDYRLSLALPAIVALFAAQMAIRFASDLNHDTAWHLYVAQGLLDGKELYKDFVEVNPPLAMWLTVPVSWAARLTGFDAVNVFYMAFFLLTALTLLAVRRYAGLATATGERGQGLLLVLAAAILLFAAGGNFGQREQLMALLFLPWLMLRAARVNGAKLNPVEAAAAGVMGAIGICMKPHSVLAPICVEIVLLLRHRQWRRLFTPENFAGAAFVAAYVAATAIFVPAYFGSMVELGVKTYLPFYGGDAGRIVSGSILAAASSVIAAALIGLVDDGAQRTLPAVLLAATAGFLAAYFAQAKGYSYQLLTVNIYAGLAAAAAFAAVAAASRNPPFPKFLATVLVALVLTLNYPPQIYPDYASTAVEKLIEKYRPASRSILIATTNVYKSFPMVLNRRVIWASRFPAQWLTPYVASKWQDGPLPDDAIVAYALDTAVGDLVQFRPDIVVVEISNEQAYVPGGRFDYLKFWAMDARFADVWKDYELRGAESGYEIYTRGGGS